MMYHPDRLTQWLAAGNDWSTLRKVYPIYMEVSPSGMCNHRCTFCALDFMEYKKRFLDTQIFQKRLTELGSLGLKSIMFGGEGEPLLHRDIVSLMKSVQESGIDLAMTTNAVFLKHDLVPAVLDTMQWVKVSINAGTSRTYAQIHRTRPEDFDTVIDNLAYAANYKEKNGKSCVLGLQLLLLPENQKEVPALAHKARNLGVDYLVVKPYSQHPASKTQLFKDITYSDIEALQDELEALNTDRFQVIVRLNAIEKWNEASHAYPRCLALPFWSYMDAGGSVWGCSMFLENDRFWYGNIYDESFQGIWEGEKRKTSMEWVANNLDAGQCRVNCRMDEINRYLWDLKNPPDHINFI